MGILVVYWYFGRIMIAFKKQIAERISQSAGTPIVLNVINAWSHALAFRHPNSELLRRPL